MNNNKVITFTLVLEDLSNEEINMIESNHIEDVVTLLRFSEEEQTDSYIERGIANRYNN